MNLQQFLTKLDENVAPLSVDQLTASLTELELQLPEIEKCLSFSSDRYQRDLIWRTDHYEALFLCFEAGQRTPIHDHCGSACGVKVICGTGIETIFKPTDDGWLYATESQELPKGGVVASNDMDIHQLSNLQPNRQRLVTLHIYSPPLGHVGNYSIEDNSAKQVTAPVNELIEKLQMILSTEHLTSN